MMKTYDVTCPDCIQEFKVKIDPETEEEYIECPYCYEEFDWVHEPNADTVALLPGDLDDDEDEYGLEREIDAEAEGDEEEEDELA